VALARIRQVERARQQIREALALDPQNAVFRQNLACLEKGGGCALTP
jgi:Flp pilus assembly protein TadD